MPGPAVHKSLWEDRFRSPTPEELLAAVCKSLLPATELASRILRDSESLRPTVQWRGVWHWTIVFAHPGDPDPAAAYLIPDPIRPRLCIPFPEAAIADLPVKRLPKSVRDGLAHAPIVAGVRWPVWDIQNKAHTEELLSLLEFVPDARPVST